MSHAKGGPFVVEEEIQIALCGLTTYQAELASVGGSNHMSISCDRVEFILRQRRDGSDGTNIIFDV
jgi:hypothetical protein